MTDLPLDHIAIDPRLEDSPPMIRFLTLADAPDDPWMPYRVLRLLFWVARMFPDGDIGHTPAWRLARESHWDGDADRFLALLVESGWLVRTASGGHRVVDWERYEGRQNYQRRKWRQHKKWERCRAAGHDRADCDCPDQPVSNVSLTSRKGDLDLYISDLSPADTDGDNTGDTEADTPPESTPTRDSTREPMVPDEPPPSEPANDDGSPPAHGDCQTVADLAARPPPGWCPMKPEQRARLAAINPSPPELQQGVQLVNMAGSPNPNFGFLRWQIEQQRRIMSGEAEPESEARQVRRQESRQLRRPRRQHKHTTEPPAYRRWTPPAEQPQQFSKPASMAECLAAIAAM